MKDKEIKKEIENGKIRINTIFEVVGHPKKHVEDTIKAYIANIKSNSDLIVLKEEYEDVDEIDKDTFSVVAEVEMLVPNLEKITWLVMNFSPASIEIIEPDKFEMQQRDVNMWLNDLLSKIHEVGVMQKAISSQNQGLIRNFNAMTRNAILLVLKESSDLSTISKKIGMDESNTEKFIQTLIKENKVNKENNLYSITR
ncbi:MAG: hypothetical protein AB7V77_03690 [Candidatus Woesearchaeota archaeon]